MADASIGLWTVPLAVFGGAIRVSTPFLFVSLGECITERSGRINLGLEGTLVMGAMSGYATSYLTGSPSLGVLLAGIGGSFLSLFYPGSWNEGLSSGQGFTAVALVIFARWNPMACFWASLLFGGAAALGPALQSVGVSQGYYLFNAAPYILTLLIMIITCSPKRTLIGAPAELSITK